jgi:hypothetical protein
MHAHVQKEQPVTGIGAALGQWETAGIREHR